MEFTIRRPSEGKNIPLVAHNPASVVRSAKQKKTLMQEDVVTIEVESAEALDVQIGDVLNVFGTDYVINQLPTVKRTGHRSFVSTLTFEGLQYGLLDKLFMPPSELGVRGSALCFDLATMVGYILDNANRGRNSMRYRLAECPEGTEYKNLSFTDQNCLQALQTCCTEWGVEFRFVQQADSIDLHIAESVGSKSPIISLEYGRHGGLYELQRQKPAGDIVTRLYAYGGTNNLMYYRHTRLCLPNRDRWGSYIEDADAVAMYGLREGVHNFEEIYPQFEGEVTSLGNDYTQFYSTDIDFDLNTKWASSDYAEWLALRGLEDTAENKRIFDNDLAGKATKYLISGTTAVVHFQTGALAGYDIDISAYNSTSGLLTLSPLVDENSYEFPSRDNTTFRIGVGDKFILLGINLPSEWKDTAERKLQEEAEAYYNNACKVQAKYNVEIQSLWLKSQSATSGTTNFFEVGDLVRVVDKTANFEGNIRINSLERDLLDVYAYKLTLTDAVEVRTMTRVASEVQKLAEVVKFNDLTDPNTRRKSWNVKSELYDMIFDTEGNYYSDKIAPQSIDTMMLKVGARSQQFTLQNFALRTNVPDSTGHPQPNVAQWDDATLIHYTISDSGVRTWYIGGGSATFSTNNALYIYARCERNTDVAMLVIDDVQRVFDAEDGYYYFLVGTLSSVIDGTRVASMTYGFTTVNGRYVSTGRIQSNDGETYFDLDTSEIGGNIKFNAGNRKEIENIVSEAVGDMSVGGRNLWKNTRDMNRYGLWKQSINNPEQNRNITLDGTKYDIFTAGYSKWAWSGWGQIIDVTPNTRYTLSYIIKGDELGIEYYEFYRFKVGGVWLDYASYEREPIFAEWERRHATFLAPADAEQMCALVASGGTATWEVCAMKMEQGSVATDWSAAPEDTDYLTQSLLQATEGTTDISGGLVLSSVMGVRDGEAVVAGMNGNADSNLPMVFAGRNNNLPFGSFQVWKDGRVVSTNGVSSVVWNNNEITMFDGDDQLNVITSRRQEGIASMLNDVKATGQKGSRTINLTNYTASDRDSTQIGYSDSWELRGRYYTYVGQTGTSTETLRFVPTLTTATKNSWTLFTATADGNIVIPAGELLVSTQYTYTNNSVRYYGWGYDEDVESRGSQSVTRVSSSVDCVAELKVNGVVIPTTLAGGRLMWEQTIIPFYNGQSVTMEASVRVTSGQLSVSATASVVDTSSTRIIDYDNEIYTYLVDYSDFSLTNVRASATMSGAVDWQYGQVAYANRLYSQGMILSSDSEHYFAIDPYAQSGDNLWKMRQGNFAWATNSTMGLHYTENGGNSWARAFPLCFVGLIEVSGNAIQNLTAEYNPRGWAFRAGNSAAANAVIVKRTAVGRYTIYHQMGQPSMIQLAGQQSADGGARVFMIVDRLANQQNIRIYDPGYGDRDSPYFWIFLYDFSM